MATTATILVPRHILAEPGQSTTAQRRMPPTGIFPPASSATSAVMAAIDVAHTCRKNRPGYSNEACRAIMARGCMRRLLQLLFICSSPRVDEYRATRPRRHDYDAVGVEESIIRSLESMSQGNIMGH